MLQMSIGNGDRQVALWLLLLHKIRVTFDVLLLLCILKIVFNLILFAKFYVVLLYQIQSNYNLRRRGHSKIWFVPTISIEDVLGFFTSELILNYILIII